MGQIESQGIDKAEYGSVSVRVQTFDVRAIAFSSINFNLAELVEVL
jgi:hypothetical protein